jgi:hypothetical protein
MQQATAARLSQETVAEHRCYPFYGMARAATRIVAPDTIYGNGCLRFCWWEWRGTFFR